MKRCVSLSGRFRNVTDDHEKCCCILHPLIDQTVQFSISIHYLAAADAGALLCRGHVALGLKTREFSFRATVAYTAITTLWCYK